MGWLTGLSVCLADFMTILADGVQSGIFEITTTNGAATATENPTGYIVFFLSPYRSSPNLFGSSFFLGRRIISFALFVLVVADTTFVEVRSANNTTIAKSSVCERNPSINWCFANLCKHGCTSLF